MANYCRAVTKSLRGTGTNVFSFSVVYAPYPLSHHGSVWVLPVISLLLTKLVSPVRACLILCWERFRGTQKEDDREPLSIKSSLACVL